MQIAKRLLLKATSIAATALLVALLCFSVVYFAPGDAATILLQTKSATGAVSAQAVADYSARLGLDAGFWSLFGDWLGGVLHGEFGRSLRTGEPVLVEFGARIGCTLALVAAAAFISALLGLTFGLLSARYDGRLADKAIGVLVSISMSVPPFWLALVLLWIFAKQLGWLPSFGFEGPQSLVLPASVLGLVYSGSIARVTKACACEHYSSQWLLTARAKGLREGWILVRHVLINISLPVITMLGTAAVNFIGVAVILESIFGLPGIGSFLLTSVISKDYTAVMGFVFLNGLLVIAINLAVDLLYRAIDPRVRQGALDG